MSRVHVSLAGPWLSRVRADASTNSFLPRHCVRCDGPALFRSQAARDLACLLDVDPCVESWSCLPAMIRVSRRSHIPDFAIHMGSEVIFADALPPPSWVSEMPFPAGYQYGFNSQAGLQPYILANAKDLLQYASLSVTLGDRVRLLACLDEHGSLPLSACAQVIRNSIDPVGTIAALALRRVLVIDLDDGPIGPQTRVTAA